MLAWPKSSFRFFHKTLWNELFGQPNNCLACFCLNGTHSHLRELAIYSGLVYKIMGGVLPVSHCVSTPALKASTLVRDERINPPVYPLLNRHCF